MTVDANTPWMTLIAGLLAILFTIVGGVVTFVHPETLSFVQYLDRSGELALAISALGAGRSVRAGLLERNGAATSMTLLERLPLTTIIVGLIVLIAGIAGGVVVIADPGTLDFSKYLDQMNTFAFAVGVQGAGRALRKGIASGAPASADVTQHPDHPDNPASFDAAAPLPGPGPADPSFVDPADAAGEDDALGALEEPLDDDDLPSDAEEFASPPPPDPDEVAALIGGADLEQPDDPNARMPSQEGSS